jgi:acyl-CoA dehydrogenase
VANKEILSQDAPPPSPETRELAGHMEAFVRDQVIPYECDPRYGDHGPSEELVSELRDKARGAGLMTPQIKGDGTHLSHRETALLLAAAGISPLGPVAVNAAAPDEGNMYLIGKLGTESQKRRYLDPLIAGRTRSAFFMTEPADEQGAGSDPSMIQTRAVRSGDDWIIDGRKIFITGALGASVGIVMARTSPPQEPPAATMFLIDLPDPAVKIERILDTIDGSMPGGHAVIRIVNLRVSGEDVLGDYGEGFRGAQIRLGPARLSHCMRWLGAARRANEVASAYACRRRAFGRPLIEHEGVGFMLADNVIELKQAELMIDWCSTVLDAGSKGSQETSMTKAAVSEALYRVADRCVQIMGGTGVSSDTIVQRIYLELRAFRIYDGPTEVHKWSIARKIMRNGLKG